MVDTKKLFEMLVYEHADMLTAYLRASLRDTATEEDIFQETLLVAWRRLDDCDTDRPFGPWLRGIAAKLVLAHYRKLSKRETSAGEQLLDQLDNKFDRLQHLKGDSFDEKIDALRDCIKDLPEKYKTPIDFHYLHEMPVKSAADKLALGVEAFRKRLQRARSRISDCLHRKLATAQPTS